MIFWCGLTPANFTHVRVTILSMGPPEPVKQPWRMFADRITLIQQSIMLKLCQNIRHSVQQHHVHISWDILYMQDYKLWWCVMIFLCRWTETHLQQEPNTGKFNHVCKHLSCFICTTVEAMATRCVLGFYVRVKYFMRQQCAIILWYSISYETFS